MSPLRQALYGLALLATLALLLWTQQLRSQAESARAERDGQALQQASERIERQAQTITQLDQALQAERTAQAQLRTLQAQLRQGLAQRERTLKELTHADPDLRTWSALPLPAAARRLRQRPALSGADAYRHWLSRSGAVPASGDGTER